MSRTAAFFVVAALAGCGGKSAGPAGPANQADPPALAGASDDVLAYLPVDSELVIGLDATTMRASAMWTKFEPQIVQALGNKLQEVTTKCGFDPLRQVERATAGGKIGADEKFEGVVVVRGVSGAKTLDCIAEASAGEGTVTNQGGVLTLDRGGSDKMVAKILGSNTLIMQFGATANATMLDGVVRGGATLRGSAAFMQLFDRREPGASVWGMVNGNSKLLASMADAGAKPRSVDGTVVIGDRFTITGRMAFATAADAENLAKQLQAIVPMMQGRVEKIDITTKGDLLQGQVIASDEQALALLGMLGL